jgi:hypothetical protein
MLRSYRSKWPAKASAWTRISDTAMVSNRSPRRGCPRVKRRWLAVRPHVFRWRRKHSWLIWTVVMFDGNCLEGHLAASSQLLVSHILGCRSRCTKTKDYREAPRCKCHREKSIFHKLITILGHDKLFAPMYPRGCDTAASCAARSSSAKSDMLQIASVQ